MGLKDCITVEGRSNAELEQAFHDSTNDHLTSCAKRGAQPDRPYGSKIPLWADPEADRKAAIYA
jgi:predicted HicB family RNase H-like nuclease